MIIEKAHIQLWKLQGKTLNHTCHSEKYHIQIRTGGFFFFYNVQIINEGEEL